MHSGSFLLALYQPWLPRCKSGPCVYVCVFAGHGGRSYFLGAWLSAGADYTFVGARMWPDECEYANACVFLSWQACASRGIGSQAFPWGVGGLRGVAVTSKGLRAHCASRPAKGGEILFMWRGLAWQDRRLTPQPGAYKGTATTQAGSNILWTTLWCRNSAPLHRKFNKKKKNVWIKEDTILEKVPRFDLRTRTLLAENRPERYGVSLNVKQRGTSDMASTLVSGTMIAGWDISHAGSSADSRCARVKKKKK